MKKPSNPVGNWGGKIERWDWLFNRRLSIKTLLTQRETEEKNQCLVRSKNKNRDNSAPRWDASNLGALAKHEKGVYKLMKNLLTQWETEEENRRFLMKTKQISDLIWPGRSYVSEQAKGSILFSLFVGAVSWSASLLLNDRLGCWLDCRSSHWRSRINKRRGCCWLLRVIFVEWAN